MKKINIYLAVADSLKDEELEISNFIRDLNDKYENFDIYLKLITNKEIEISSSELFLVLFCDDAKNETKKEFEIAYQNFVASSNPKIATYIKKSNNPTKSLQEFIQYLDEELKHYYSLYENLDTIKLNIVLWLKNLGLEEGKVEAKDNKLYISGEEVLELSNIPIIKNNQDLKKIKKQKEELEDKYWKLKEKVLEDEDNEELLNEYLEVKKEKKELEDSIHELEKSIIDLESTFINITGTGKISKRQIYAKKCLEEGNLEAAKEALDFKEIQDDANKIIELHDKNKEKLAIFVNELNQRIYVLKLDINNKNRFQEIEKTYEEIIRIEKEGGLPREGLFKYTKYLYYEKNFNKAIQYGEKYLNYLNLEEDDKNSLDFFKVYNLLGLIYNYLLNYQKSLDYNLKALEIIKKLTKEDYENNAPNLATIYHNLGLLYDNINRYDEAIKYYQKAIEINKKFPKNIEKLATNYNGLGSVYQSKMEYSKSLEYYLKSFEINEDINKKTNGAHEGDLAIVCNNLGNLYIYLKEYDKAKYYLTKNIELYEKLNDSNPAYASSLANSYNNLGGLYDVKGEKNEAYNYYLKGLKLREKLINFDSGVTLADLANSYHNLGSIYSDLSEYEKAIKYYQKSLKIREELNPITLDAYEKDLASDYNGLGYAYKKLNNQEKALEYYLKNLELSKKVNNLNSIGLAYSNLGSYYKDNANYEEALKCFLKTMEIREELVQKNKKIYEQDLAITYYSLANIYNIIKDYQKNIDYNLKCLKIHKVSNNHDLYREASIYHNLGYSYFKLNEYQKSLKNYLKGISIMEKLTIEDSKYEDNLAIFYTNLGNFYETTTNYSKALEYYLKNFEIRKKYFSKKAANYARSYMSACRYVAEIYEKNKNYKLALDYQEEALKVAETYVKDNNFIEIRKEEISKLKELLKVKENN